MVHNLEEFLRPAPALSHGQRVIVTARWLLVVSGLGLALWQPGQLEALRIQILALLLLAVTNFYLHAQLLKRQAGLDAVAYAASVADLLVITLLVYQQGGLESDLYVFYFPAILAFTVAFPTQRSLLFGGGILVGYSLICLAGAVATSANWQLLLARLLMFSAVGFCGNLFRRIEEEQGGR